MALAEVTVFAHQTGEVEIVRLQRDAQLFAGFTAAAGMGRFADPGFQFASTRTPQPLVGFLGSFEQQHIILRVKAVEQGRDPVGQRHCPSESGKDTVGKQGHDRTVTAEPIRGRVGVTCCVLHQVANVATPTT